MKSASWEIKASAHSHGHTSNTLAKNKDEKKANVYLDYKCRWLRWNMLWNNSKKANNNTFLLRFRHAVFNYPVWNFRGTLAKICMTMLFQIESLISTLGQHITGPISFEFVYLNHSHEKVSSFFKISL